jgi:hypothetical protein
MTVSREAPIPVKAAFDARWDVPDDPPLLKKADRLQLAMTEPVAVATVAVPVEQLARATPLDEKQAEAEKHHVRLRRAEVEHDVCTRHGMHKVWIEKRHWRSWRCRR